ncbi:hypothetical protein ACFQZZ_00420 [Nocardia sp. GCM10030253]|uniref:hypothetical protein n=1 Tax=Nocardia sp. GCM10030253 TaxID=3273404 RepID=UPI00363E665F
MPETHTPRPSLSGSQPCHLADRDALLNFISLHLPGSTPPTMCTVIPKELDEQI